MFIVHNCVHVWRYMYLFIAISPIVFLFILQILQIVFMPLFYLMNKYENVFWVYLVTYIKKICLQENLFIHEFLINQTYKTNTLQLNTENKIVFLSLLIKCAYVIYFWHATCILFVPISLNLTFFNFKSFPFFSWNYWC